MLVLQEKSAPLYLSFPDMCAFFTDKVYVVRRLYVTVSCVEMRKKIIEIRLPILSRKMYDRENAI